MGFSLRVVCRMLVLEVVRRVSAGRLRTPFKSRTLTALNFFPLLPSRPSVQILFVFFRPAFRPSVTDLWDGRAQGLIRSGAPR
jgi:hypothetical protein